VLEWLRVREDGIYVDCTAGAGGHSLLIAEQLRGGRLLALDRDPIAVRMASERLRALPAAKVVNARYAELIAVLAREHIECVDGVLIDAGVSSMQLDDPARGFSFQSEGPLDMRMDTTQSTTAASFLATAREKDIERVLRDYGDVRRARSIARAICAARSAKPLETTTDLVAAIRHAFPHVDRIPEETRTVFQAIRIATNNELDELEVALRAAVGALRPGGRLVVISFHSGEDAIAKSVLRELGTSRVERAPDGRTIGKTRPLLRVLTRKPIVPTADEVRANPRAHSARLRAAEKLSGGEAA
jgi:16S rRNA (cytosine1402-N4)-methyltransferase